MRANVIHSWLRRLPFLLIGLVLVSQSSSGFVRGAALLPNALTVNLSNPSCVQAQAGGTCSIQFTSLVVASSDPSFSRVELLVNGKLRILMSGFFETSAYLTPSMIAGGLKVACGQTNDGGLPNYGKSYLVTANAYLANGTTSTNSATVYCPAYDGRTYLPIARTK